MGWCSIHLTLPFAVELSNLYYRIADIEEMVVEMVLINHQSSGSGTEVLGGLEVDETNLI